MRVYFDITDIVEYARSNPRVSGIQRVQARVISSLGRLLGPEHVRCTFCDERSGQLYEFDPRSVFTSHEFDSQMILFKLGQLEDAGRLPDKREIKRYLSRYQDRKMLRALKKLQIYATALLRPDALPSMGIRHPRKPPGLELAPLTPLSNLAVEDVFVFLGSNWTFPGALNFGKSHFHRGGVVVQMIYDIIPFKTPEHCTPEQVAFFKRFLEQIPTYANAFLAISEWSRTDFLDYLHGRGIEREVVTVPLAHELDGFARNERHTAPSDPTLTKLLASPFVLCVGTLESRKNGRALLDVWARMLAEGEPKVPQLVFAGKVGWKTEAFFDQLKHNALLRNKVTLLNAPSDQDLAFLYQNCAFSAYPSFYEGWGLPVGEAAWFGKHVIASSATSLPEVCGDLIDYIDPANLDDLHAKVVQAIRHPERLTERMQRIRCAPLRTWDEVAKSVYDAISNQARSSAAA